MSTGERETKHSLCAAPHFLNEFVWTNFELRENAGGSRSRAPFGAGDLSHAGITTFIDVRRLHEVLVARWNSKGHTPTLGFYLVPGRGAAWPACHVGRSVLLQMVIRGDETKREAQTSEPCTRRSLRSVQAFDSTSRRVGGEHGKNVGSVIADDAPRESR